MTTPPTRQDADARHPADRESLERLGELSVLLAGELDPGRLLHAILQTASDLTGAAYAAYFERVPASRAAEETWRLGALTGAPEEAFTSLGLPRQTALFAPTFRGRGVVQSDDVPRDAAYGSMGGMPPGHLPVRSYLAVPVTSRAGEHLGALLLGHPEPRRFGARETRLVSGFAAQAAVAIDNAALFRSLNHQKERFRAAIEATQGVLWTNDAEGRMTGEQPGWSALTGQSEAEYEGYGWAQAVHPDDAQPSILAWNEAVAERKPFIFEHRVRRHDGAWRVFSIRAIPVMEPGGAIREWVGVHTDITEQRRAETALRESNEELQRYTHMISHDLRAPLVNIMGFTSELQSSLQELVAAGAAPANLQQFQDDFQESLSFILEGTQRMDRLLTAILKLSREGRRKLNYELVDVNAVISGLIASQAHQIQSTGAQIEVGVLPPVRNDRAALEQVLGNLLDNALKYRDPVRPLEIRVMGERDSAFVRYSIEDTGRGIGASDTERVFQIFRRAGPKTVPGEGVGLAYVEALTRTMGGTVVLDSALGRGSRFTVQLPRRV